MPRAYAPASAPTRYQRPLPPPVLAVRGNVLTPAFTVRLDDAGPFAPRPIYPTKREAIAAAVAMLDAAPGYHRASVIQRGSLLNIHRWYGVRDA